MENIDYRQKTEEISNFIRSTVYGAGFKKVIIALSGGVDSAVSCALAVKALSPENVFTALLPFGALNTEGLDDAKSVIQTVMVPKENIFEIDIKKAVDAVVSLTSIAPDEEAVRKGNIMARVRMVYLFDLAKKHNALVLGTENKTEHLLGYYTRFGDEASDIEPIRSLYKTQIWEMAKFLGLPEKIVTKPPTAGLWTGQTDEKEFGFKYYNADKILSGYFDEKLSVDDIANKYSVSMEIIKKVLAWAEKNSFKHNLPKIYEGK